MLWRPEAHYGNGCHRHGPLPHWWGRPLSDDPPGRNKWSSPAWMDWSWQLKLVTINCLWRVYEPTSRQHQRTGRRTTLRDTPIQFCVAYHGGKAGDHAWYIPCYRIGGIEEHMLAYGETAQDLITTQLCDLYNDRNSGEVDYQRRLAAFMDPMEYDETIIHHTHFGSFMHI